MSNDFVRLLMSIFYIAFLFFILLCMTACSTVQPAIKVETVEVKIPVRVPCAVAIPEQPTWVVPTLNKEASIFEKMKALLIDRELSFAYQAQLETGLEACKR